MERTTELAKRARRFMEEHNILPKYDRLHSSEEHISYSQFLRGYFLTISLEIERYLQFQVKLGEVIRGEIKWYTLQLENYHFASSSNKEKILQLKRRVEEFHGDQNVYKEFKDIFDG